MNLQHSRIAERCEALKLQRMAVEWPAVAAEAAKKDASFADFLERLLETETDDKAERQERDLVAFSNAADAPLALGREGQPGTRHARRRHGREP